LRRCVEKIVLKIREVGLSIVAQMDAQLTKDQAEELYDMCKNKDYYGDLVQYMTRFVYNFDLLDLRLVARSGAQALQVSVIHFYWKDI